MNRLFARANKRISLGSAAALLAGMSLIGAFLGILRTRLIYTNFDKFGPESTDVFFAAFKIPDFVYFTVAAGALGVAFMPIINDKVARSDKKGAWELVSGLVSLMILFMGIFALLLIVFARPLIHYIVAPKLTPEQLDNAVTIMRLVAFSPLFFSVSAVLTTVQQTYGRFFFYAIAPLFYNLSIIASIFIFKDNIGIVGLGIGTFVGGVLQLLVVCLGMAGIGGKYRFRINWKDRDFKEVLYQLPPRSVDQGIDHINSIAETRFARRLGEGYISDYEGALTLQNAPIQLIGTAISTAAFPRFTERLSQGRPDLFRKEFLQVLRVMIWLSAPVVIISYFSRGYLARLIYADKAPEIALLFGYLSFAIFFRSIYAIISRYFYAQKDTKTPLYVSLFVIALNIVLAAIWSAKSAYGVAGLAMAQLVVSVLEVVVLFAIMIIRDPKLLNKKFWGGVSRILSVTGFTAVTAIIMLNLMPLYVSDGGMTVMGKLILITIPILSMHLLMSWVFSLEEIQPIIARAKRVLFRPIKL